MKKVISIGLTLLLIFPSIAFADGMIHIEDPDMYYWRVYDENQQLCAINYENGYQNMILTVDINNMNIGQRGVWIFPVPASPDKTVIDIVKGFPNMGGNNVKSQVDGTIFGMFSTIRLSQIYTFPFFILRSFMGGSMLSSANIGSYGKDSEGVQDVTIYEHIEKYGLVTELVSTKNGDSLYNYLTQKGLSLPTESKRILDEYVGDDYSFVVSWFSGTQVTPNYGYYYPERQFDTISISLKFPTEKIYYPLKPTSVYGSKRVPAIIYVMGHVTPKLYPEIKMDSEVTYFVANYYYPQEELKSFFNYKQYFRDLKYTKIKINPPSKYLTQDLWIEMYAPANIVIGTSIINYAFIWGLFFFTLTSYLASMLAGKLTFKKDKSSLNKLGLFGLWNFLTIIGFAIATLFMRTKKLEPELESRLKKSGLKVWDGRKVIFVGLFSIFFLIISFIFQVILHLIF